MLKTFAVALVTAATAKIAINSDSRMLVDEFGRSVIFHGVNVVYKVDPYLPSQGEFSPEDSLNDEDI